MTDEDKVEESGDSLLARAHSGAGSISACTRS